MPEGEKTSAPHLTLPQGVESIVPIKAQNGVMVYGTKEGIKELKEIIQILDRGSALTPVADINLENQLVSIDQKKLTGVWSKLAAQAATKKPAMEIVAAEDLLFLNTLISNRDAHILITKSVSTDSNATAKLFMANPRMANNPYRREAPSYIPEDFSSAMPIYPPSDATAEMPGFGSGQLPKKLFAFDFLNLDITPTLNNDRSTTLKIEGEGLASKAMVSIANIPSNHVLVFGLPVNEQSGSNRLFLIITPRRLISFTKP